MKTFCCENAFNRFLQPLKDRVLTENLRPILFEEDVNTAITKFEEVCFLSQYRTSQKNEFLKLVDIVKTKVQWRDYSEWSSCSKHCCKGTQKRLRNLHCSTGFDEDCLLVVKSTEIEERDCNTHQCPHQTISSGATCLWSRNWGHDKKSGIFSSLWLQPENSSYITGFTIKASNCIIEANKVGNDFVYRCNGVSTPMDQTGKVECSWHWADARRRPFHYYLRYWPKTHGWEAEIDLRGNNADPACCRMDAPTMELWLAQCTL